MAYYAGGYIWPQEQQNNVDLVVYQNLASYFSDESYGLDSHDSYDVSHEPRFVDYYHYTDDYDSYSYGHNSDSCTIPAINYSAHNYVEVEPKLNMYEPVKCDTGHDVSDINSGFNEPEFDEYDPNPYGGGYDIVSVYGKPLPPSDTTCYPHSKPKRNDLMPDPKPTLTSIAAPNPIVEPTHEPENKHEPKSRPELNMASPTPSEPESKPVSALVPAAASLQLTEATERETNTYPDHAYDYSWPEYDNGYGIGAGYDYGYGKQIVKIPPYEYHPEVDDLCENMFGSWPCLSRIREEQFRNNPAAITCPENVPRNQWEDCANYIFGGGSLHSQNFYK